MEPVALIFGCANSIWSDLALAKALAPSAPICAVNDIGAYYPGELGWWVSRHKEIFDPLLFLRRARGFPMGFRTRVGANGSPGGSGIEAIVYMLDKAVKLILCGMPLDGRPHFYDPPTVSWNYTLYRDGWEQAKTNWNLENRVRSMSGWTKDLFGAPDDAFLRG